MGSSSNLVPVASALLLLSYLIAGNNGFAAAGTSTSSDHLKLNYYSESCPRAEEIVKEQVKSLYEEHGNTAVSWLRALFHDCTVKSCDASLLLESNAAAGLVSEKSSTRSFGMRNFKYIDAIKSALERACPGTVSCADLLALAARDGAAMLGGPADIPMRTGRRDATESHYGEVESFIPNHNESVSAVLDRFASMGVDAEGVVALLGAHSVGRVHCFNLVARLYPAVDGTIEPAYGTYLRGRCPTAEAKEDTRDVAYARNDRVTPMVLDNMYHKNLLKGRGLLLVDQRLATDPRTAPYVRKMAADNAYFHDVFAAALVKMSENGPLTGDQGEVRKDCRFVNK
ncbi:peroxidase 21-like isoform X1 [Lolium rigidum]|uniref:peroxidase 21-like isoform X1 n=1 Tax=Lolium rigidum TaxID=89674 RepID=UPI001F5D82E9|nr:peroxidase 21-like isoform X1 [Lolium rigidum]